MHRQIIQQSKSRSSYAFYLKCGAVFVLFLLSILIVACGSGTDTSLGQPPVTVTINLGQSNGSPTPSLPDYTCSAWVTNTSPSVFSNSVIGVYAKFVHNVNGNPEGVYPASATATVMWPDGNVDITSNTTSDGLAVFSVSTANRAADLNKIVLVTVSFTGPQGVPPCTIGVDQAAYFTLVVASGGSPTVVGSTATSTGGFTPTVSVSPSATACIPTGGAPIRKTPTPIPTPCH